MSATTDAQIALAGYLTAFLISVACAYLGTQAAKKEHRVLYGLGANFGQFASLLFFGWLLLMRAGGL